MSIEIIEKPKHKCSVCGCVFSFDKEDLIKFPTGHDELYLCCPVCYSHDIAFEDNVIKL